MLYQNIAQLNPPRFAQNIIKSFNSNSSYFIILKLDKPILCILTSPLTGRPPNVKSASARTTSRQAFTSEQQRSQIDVTA